MLKIILSLIIYINILHAVDLGNVEVNAKGQEEVIEQNSFTEVFEEPEYYESVNRVESMPSQKRITTKEALFIPGVQGDPIKAVQSLSGVTTLGDSSGELFIYGSKPEESITTINHLPIGYLFHMGGLHSVIAPDAIEQIDAYMAGFGATYGDAMGGVINVTPSYPDDTYSGYYHMGIYDASVGINAPINEKTSVYFGARRSYFDLFLAAVGEATGTLDEDTNTTYTEFPNYYDMTFIMNYTHDSSNMYSLELITANDSLEIASQENIIKDPEAVGQIKADFGFTTIGARHQGSYNDYETNSLLYYKYERRRTSLFDGYFIDIDSHESGFFHQSTLNVDSHKLVAGVELQSFVTPIELNITTPPSADKPDYDFTSEEVFYINNTFRVNSATIFLEDIYTLNERTTMRYGVRASYSDYNSLNGYIDPRFSLLYMLNDFSNVSFSTGIYSQTPEGHKISDDIGNPKAKFERSQHYVLHYDNSLYENTTFNIDLFYKKYLDLLIEDELNKFENNGDGYAYGIDASVKVRRDDLYLFGAYTYMKSQRELNTNSSDLHRFYAEVPHTLQLIAGKKFWENWAVSMRMDYHSGSPYTKVIGTYDDSGRIRPIYEDPFNSRLPDYFSLNLKIAQEVKVTKDQTLEWSFELMNLTNHENVSEINYDDNYNEDGYSKGLPFLPWFDLTYRF